MSMRVRSAAVLLALALLPGLVHGLPAMGGDGFVRETTPASARLAVLMPGGDVTRQYDVTNRLGSKATLFVIARHIQDDDNGCVLPESIAGDQTCGAGGGELTKWLRVSVFVGNSATPTRLMWAGRLDGFTYGAVVVPNLAPKGTIPIRVVASLPREAGNDTQSDRVSYDLKWVLVGSGGQHTSATTRVSARS